MKSGRRKTGRILSPRPLRSASRLKPLPAKGRPSRHGHRLFSCLMFRPALLPLSSPKRNNGLESGGQPRKMVPFRAVFPNFVESS